MRLKALLLFLLLWLGVAGGALGFATDLEGEIQRDLLASSTVAKAAIVKLDGGATVAEELSRLKALAENIRITHLLLQERFDERRAALEGAALVRQQVMEARYTGAVADYLQQIEALPAEQALAATDLAPLLSLIDKIIPRKAPPILGSLPYKHLNFPPVLPRTEPAIIPAYKGGEAAAAEADTQVSAAAPITAEIAALAESLEWNPVKIYEWVQGNIESEWYWGSMKGATETLRQKSGNDADQAALLTALLRASGYPSRFVRGTIEFFPGIDKVRNLTGLDDPLKIATFFQKAGIPFEPVVAGGRIANFRIEHFWVETLVPYSNYRGALIDDFGKVWVALDTHIKPAGYRWNEPADFGSDFPLAEVRDDYLVQPRAETPLAYLRERIEQNGAGTTYAGHLRQKSQLGAPLDILPASLQFTTAAITGEYAELPQELRHTVTLSAADLDGGELFSLTLDASKVASRQLILSYEPETVADQRLIDSYGGLDNTPSYLVHLRPVLLLEGERLIVARGGLPMGAAFTLAGTLNSPHGSEETTGQHIVGNLSAIGVVCQQAVAPEEIPLEKKDAARLLFEEAISYVDRWNASEKELASLLKLALVRPLPTVVTVGGVIDVTYLLDTPHGFTWKGVFIDAGLRRVETVAKAGQQGREKEFMRLSALEGSILEHRLFEDDFGVASVSTAKLLALAPQNLATVLTLDGSNADALLPTLDLTENVAADIENAVHQGFVVTVPERETAYKSWSGIGYIKESSVTGEAGYMLSGIIAGGMTAEGWANNLLASLFKNAYSEPANQEPAAAALIVKIPVGDRQSGTVGMATEEPLAVLVLDLKGRPVSGATVTFTVLDGGGDFGGTQAVQAVTETTGIAKAWPTLGTKTDDNPSFQRVNQEDTYATQVGANLFTASVESPYGALTLSMPFEIYGRPDQPVDMVKVLGDYNLSMANNPAGSIKVRVVDQYGNPVSNVPVTFAAKEPSPVYPSFPLPAGYRNIEFYRKTECSSDYPLHGDCATAPSMLQMTGYTGASVYTILGNTVATEYRVEAGAPGVQSQTFTLFSGGFWEEGEYLPPQLYLRYLTTINDRGEVIDAAKVGEPLAAPLSATMFLLTSDYTMEGPKTCTRKDADGNSEPYDCWTVRGSGLVNIERIANGTVDFEPVEGNGTVGAVEKDGEGTYRAAYTTGQSPLLNRIQAVGEATVTVPEVLAYSNGVQIEEGYPKASLSTRTVALKSGQKGLFDRSTKDLLQSEPQKIPYEIYGVAVPSTVAPVVVSLNDNGTARDNTVFNYTILPQGDGPAGYSAVGAEVDLFSVGLSGGESWDGYLVGDALHGSGTAVFSFGSAFDPAKNYYAQAVLNRGGDVEIRGEKIPLGLLAQDHAFQVGRRHLVSEFDSPDPGSIGATYSDTYQTFSFEMPEPGSVKVSILDENKKESGTLVSETSLGAGEYSFVVDYEQVRGAGFDFTENPTFYVQLERRIAGRTEGHNILYGGRMNESTTTAKMLGQTMVHDVLIQDGSLNLSRQDIELKGRGPQLAFSRSYNNQNSPRGFKPLGRGWSHSLDMRLQVLSTDPNTTSPVPAWVSSLKGRFFTSDDLSQQPKLPTMVQVNGTIFKLKNGLWYAERGKHGTLEGIVGGFLFTAKDGTRYRYDKSYGEEILVSAIEDRNGNTLTFAYDASGHLEKVTDAVGRSLDFYYQKLYGFFDDDHNRLVSVSGPDGIELTFAYNADGYLKSATRAGRVETYEYAREPGIKAGEFNLVKATDANGHSYAYEYFGVGEVHPNLANFTRVLKSQDIVKSVTYPDGNAAVFQYDVATANKRIVTDLRGNDTVYTLNYYGNPTKIEEPLGKTTQMTWSIDEGKPDNVMTSRTDALGNTTTYEYDSRGNVTRETDPYGNSIVTVWNLPYSLPEQRTDRNGVVQSWSYDANGNLLRQTDGDSHVTVHTYTATGEVETTTDPRGNLTRYSYDAYGNPNRVTGPEGSVTDLDYDVRGRKVAETDPNFNMIEYAYDALDYPTSVTYPTLTAYGLPAGSSSVKSTVYDPLGNLLSETDRVGLTLHYTYTPRNQVEIISRSVGGQKSFAYDANGNLTSETDWKGATISHSYDALSRRVSTANRLGDSMSMDYDLNGNLISVTDYEGRVTRYAYDELGRQTEIIQPPLPGQGEGHIVKTYYAEANPETNLWTVTDAEGNVTAYEYNGRYQRTRQKNALGGEYLWNYDDAGNLASETDEEGRLTSYAYDRQNRRTSMTQPGGILTAFQCDAAGNRIRVTDPRGKLTRTEYDSWNRPHRVTDADGYATATELDGEGREVKVTDGNGNSRTRVRDARGLVLSATDAENQSTAYTYDLNGNVETVTNARGFATRTIYDAEDRKLLTTQAEGTPEERVIGVLAYDKVGNPLQVRDGNGNVTVTQYNALNLPWKRYDPAPFAANFVETLYDRNGKPVSLKNRLGHVTATQYDALGRVVTVTDPLQQTILTTYDKVGNVLTVTDKRGIVTTNTYDDLNRLVEQSRAGVRLVTNEYDGVGNLTAVVDANGNRTEHAYTGRNLLEVTTFADDTSASRSYDGAGNPLTLTDEEGEVTTYTYDRENRLKTTTFANETTENFYDAVGNLSQLVKPKGNDSTRTYDGLNRLTSVTEGGLLTTGYTYDANGNLRTQTDPRGNVVEYVYDQLNRKKQHIQHKPSGNLLVSYDLYDSEGNLTQMTDAKGQVFRYEYDELGRRTKTVYPVATTPFLTIQEVATSYDANNNVETVTETKQQSGGGTVTDTAVNTWDNFDRLKTSTQRGMTLSYGYDNNGNRTSVSTVNGSTTYTFDHRNRLKTAFVGEDVTTYTYTPDGLTDTVAYPNGASAKYTYFPTNRVETITHKDNSGAILSSFAYQYDANGNRTKQVEVQGGASETTDYKYDDLDRLSRYTVSGAAKTTVTGYTFEGYNRKTETATENGAVVASKIYSYDETNWLTKVEEAGRTVTYGYDANGNTVLKSDSSKPGEDVVFDYDVANHLVRTTQGAVTLGQYDYNADGMRVRHYGSERGDIDYFYDDGAVLEEYADGASGGLLAHYRYGDRLLSLEAPGDGGVQYYHHDALGSTVNLTDSAGGTKVSYTLDPWGHIRSQQGSSVNRQVFTGQEHDENTGLIYFGARYYDPDSARFLSQDSYLGEPGTPPSLHRYLYAYGNPTVYVDLYGNWSWPANANEPEWDFSPADNLGSKVAQAVPEAYAKTRGAFPEAMNNAYAKGVENGLPGLDNDGARLTLTVGSTLTQATLGVGLFPLTKTVEAIEYGKDPKQLQNFPVFATSVRDTYRASEAAAKDGSVNNWLNVGAAALGGVLEVAAVGSGVKAIAETAASPKSGITVESFSGATNTIAAPKGDLIPLKNNSIRNLLKSRGLSKQQAKDIANSADGQMYVRQGYEGELLTVTESAPGQASGIFTTRGSAGATPAERIKNLALPPSNTAMVEGNLKLTRDQLLIESRVGPQLKWGIDRKGGGWQVITDGGSYSGSVKRVP